MDINALESSSEGRLIVISRKPYSFLAPTKSGIIKFNRAGEVIELGLDHNTTLKVAPIAFTFVSSDDITISSVTRRRAWLRSKALSIRYRLDTNKGRLDAYVRLDANDDSEVVVTATCIHHDKCNVTGRIAMQFNLMGDFIEMINSSKLKLAVLSNDDNDLCVINSIENVSSIVVNSKVVDGSESNTCIVTSEIFIDSNNYNPMIFKLGIKQDQKNTKTIKVTNLSKLRARRR